MFDNWSRSGNAAFLGLQRTGFGVALSLITLPLLFGKLSPICSALGHKLWEPLAKLSFSMFLCHIICIRVTLGYDRSGFYWNYANIYKEFIFLVVFAYVLATTLYMLVEAPFANLEKAMWDKIRGRKK